MLPIIQHPYLLQPPTTTLFDDETFTYTITTTDAQGDAVTITAIVTPTWTTLTNQQVAIVSTLGTIMAGPNPVSVTNVAVGPDNTVYVSSSDDLTSITPDGIITPLVNGLTGIRGVAVRPDNTVLIATDNDIMQRHCSRSCISIC